ncbi:AAA family ATPase [Thiocapsa imhoffii]|uniref:AAA family ATPase n=1 Tax=Thiocapsa imhoffii TaxID=382777 RepID=UPI0019042B74|nr:ATP-binding protein [Thiocapsa imhoffii]
MSFRDPVTFSMVGTAERQHTERVPRVEQYRTKILPIAAIDGGNASGKTTVFQALNVAKRFVTQGVLPDARIPVEPLRLDPAMAERPSRFAFELLIRPFVASTDRERTASAAEFGAALDADPRARHSPTLRCAFDLAGETLPAKIHPAPFFRGDK